MGKERPEKFVYEDAWGDLVARNEAWIKLEGLVDDIARRVFPLDIVANIIRQQELTHSMEMHELRCTYMERFWESTVMTVYQEVIT